MGGKIDLGNITGTRRLTSAVPLAATPWRVWRRALCPDTPWPQPTVKPEGEVKK